MTTDYRALCAELVDDLEEWVNAYLISDPPDERTAESFERIDRARADLAKPEPATEESSAAQPADREVAIPCYADIAAAMVLLGESYLHEHAPERLAKPEPPKNGEVAELVAWLLLNRDTFEMMGPHQPTYDRFTRAADLLSRLAPQPVPEGPTDAELLELMPQQFRDDLATVSRLAAHGTSPDVTPGLFRVSLNTGALDYARAVLARWGRP